MDSVSVPAQRQHLGALTGFAAVVLVAFVLLMAWLQYGGAGVEGVEEPERALALIVGRTMDTNAAVARAPAWERFGYRLISTEPADDLAESIRWYEELAAVSFDPALDLHLAILEGEAGRLASVRRRAEEWQRRPDPLPELARLVAAAYLDANVDAVEAATVGAAVAEVLEPGWFRDRLATRLATRTGDRELLAEATAAQAARSDRLLARMRAMIAIQVVLLGAGLAALGHLVRRRGTLARIGAAVLPPPWRGRDGVAVLVRGGALGAITMVVIYFSSVVGPERPFARVVIGTATNLAFVPLLLLAHRGLLRPAGLGFVESFGLRPGPGGWRGLLVVFVALMTIAQLGQTAIDVAARGLGLSAHWTEWFDRDLAWGTPFVVGVTLVDTVLLTPVFEEIVFRGLLFATLRRRFGVSLAAVSSAALFAVAHGYGAVGFAAVFWSGLLWAWAYERTGSLLPPMALHATDNLMASLSVILVLRG